MSDRDEIVQQAMSLSPADRAYVADVLEQSLPTGGFATPEIAAAWTAEIERRIGAFDRGELSAVDMQASLENMRQQLARHRARQANP